jgi:hypothetical protein
MYTPIENRLGIQPIAFVTVPNTTLQSGQTPFANQEHPLGTIMRAYDPIYGEGEFIYMQSVASTIVGSWVTYGGYGTISGQTGNFAQFQTVLMATTANQDADVAIAMAPFPAGSPATAFGWYQISGVAIAGDSAMVNASPPIPVYTTGSGLVSNTAVAGKQVLNARALTADGTPSAGLFLCQINRPFLQGQIT